MCFDHVVRYTLCRCIVTRFTETCCNADRRQRPCSHGNSNEKAPAGEEHNWKDAPMQGEDVQGKCSKCDPSRKEENRKLDRDFKKARDNEKAKRKAALDAIKARRDREKPMPSLWVNRLRLPQQKPQLPLRSCQSGQKRPRCHGQRLRLQRQKLPLQALLSVHQLVRLSHNRLQVCDGLLLPRRSNHQAVLNARELDQLDQSQRRTLRSLQQAVDAVVWSTMKRRKETSLVFLYLLVCEVVLAILQANDPASGHHRIRVHKLAKPRLRVKGLRSTSSHQLAQRTRLRQVKLAEVQCSRRRHNSSRLTTRLPVLCRSCQRLLRLYDEIHLALPKVCNSPVVFLPKHLQRHLEHRPSLDRHKRQRSLCVPLRPWQEPA